MRKTFSANSQPVLKKYLRKPAWLDSLWKMVGSLW